jgi:cytochrome c biogenesis protein CcmG/thiol:disulfide interchange protein DsbE
MPETPEPTEQKRKAASGDTPLFRLLQLVALAAVAALLALLGWRLVDDSRGGSLVSAVRAGKMPLAPPFRLQLIWPHVETWPQPLRKSLRDGRVALGDLRGTPVVLNFWASWCVPCKKEAPLFVASASSHRGQVAFLGIDIQDFESDARHFLASYHVNYVSLRDGGGSTASRYGVTGLPETYFIDRQGRIVAHVPGQVSSAQLAEGVRLIAAPSR